MREELFENIKKIMEKTAQEMNLELISVKFLPSGDNGPTLEVLLDKDYHIGMEEIQAFTDAVNPLIDELEDDDPEGYVLDISSGGSERVIPYSDLEKLIGEYIDITLKTGERILAKLLIMEDGLATFEWFIKGRRKKKTISEEEIAQMKMGYKA